MTATWRLPEWLGGHEVQVYAISENGLAATIDIVGHEGASPDSPTVRVPREWLIEVRPPSIDDPVTLPLTLKSCTGYSNSIWVQQAGLGDNPDTVITIGPGVRTSYTVRLAADQLRELARALWQRANEVEAQP